MENVILEKDKKILLIFFAVCEAYKDDPQMRKLFNEYNNEFENEKLSVDNIDERLQYLKSSTFFNYVPEKITKLVDIYSVSIFKFVLERYFHLKNYF